MRLIIQFSIETMLLKNIEINHTTFKEVKNETKVLHFHNDRMFFMQITCMNNSLQISFLEGVAK